MVGSHVVDLLLERGYDVRVLDNLKEEIHGKKMPEYISEEVEFVEGDVRNRKDWKRALDNVDAVSHQAAMINISGSIENPVDCLEPNVLGTAKMYEVIKKEEIDIQKIIVASSMSTYGEGLYRCEKHGYLSPNPRGRKQLERKEWEIKCPKCERELEPKPTPETKEQQNLSTYAVSKYSQERLCLNYGSMLEIPTIVLRYFNVSGPRQYMKTPYTAVSSIFSKINRGERPMVTEDGNQSRDFIDVRDVSRANLKALKSEETGCFNVGTGKRHSILQLTETLLEICDSDLKPRVTGNFRPGDVRHCFADTEKSKSLLDFEAKISFEKSLEDMVEWRLRQGEP